MIVKNTTEHSITINKFDGVENVTFAALSETEVDADFLNEAMQKDSVRVYFDSGHLSGDFPDEPKQIAIKRGRPAKVKDDDGNRVQEPVS